MYGGVPISAPRPATVASGRARFGSVAVARSSGALKRATPKSATRTRPSSPTSRLSGFTSRWISPTACAAISPRPACTNTPTTSCHVRGASSRQRRTVRPATNSIATNTCPAYTPMSWIATMFGCDSLASAWASRISIAWLRRARAPSTSAYISLIATLRASSGSSAA
jgi:hypothetical protein